MNYPSYVFRFLELGCRLRNESTTHLRVNVKDTFDQIQHLPVIFLVTFNENICQDKTRCSIRNEYE